MKEEKGSSPFTDQAYDVYIKAFDQRGQEKPVGWLPCLKVSKLGFKLLFAFFDLLRSESLHHNYARDLSDEFGNVSSTLFKNFDLDNLDDKGSLEGSVKDYIQKLEEYNYFLPRGLVEFVDKSNHLTALESGIGYKGDLDSVVDCVRDILKSLRDEKITFWKEVFEKYKQDKEGYDLGFRTKQARHKNDLDRFSKIDIKEYIDKLGSIGKRKEDNKN